MDYEGMEDNNKYIAQYFENLSIDIQNNNIPKLKSFYIKSEQFYPFLAN